MLRRVTAINEAGVALAMDLSNPELSGLVVKKITGLGPADGVINTTALSTADGNTYNSARIEERVIDLYLQYYDVPSAVFDTDESTQYRQSIETIRQKTYEIFPIKYPVILIFETDVRSLYIVGYVEKNKPEIFEAASNTVISIRCPYPYFYGYDSNEGTRVIDFSSTNPEFQFAFENVGLLAPTLEMGDIQTSQEKTVFYTGDAPVGVTISIQASGPVKNIAVYNRTSQEVMRIDTAKLETVMGSPFTSGDELIITTQRGGKSMYLLRGGETTNVINALARDADWIQIRKGGNILSFIAEEGQGNLIMKISYKIIYEGV